MVRPSETKGPVRGPFPFSPCPYALDPLKPSSLVQLLGALLALLLLAPTSAAAADTYESSWNGGHLIATANAGFTEATIESVEVNFDECGTVPGEATCTWEAIATLYSGSQDRCNPSTPEDQVVWDSGEQSGNGTVTDGPKSFPLEGCRGQSLSFRIEFHKTYEETPEPSPWRTIGGASEWPMFTFGYHPAEEADRSIPTEYNPPEYEPPHFQPNFTPTKTFALSADCRTLQLDSTRYVFVFGQMGCYKAGNLARARFLSGRAPRGYACQNDSRGGVRCRRRHKPAKFFEWHVPRSGS